ncbi:MAG: hypothetical protein HW403_630, partial [Dehalococcoidia bacterium]|nr:hypothetical protein [Dehalococcoidia bacterium]
LQRLEEKLRQEFSERMEVARVERVRLERNLTEVTGTQERHSATLEEAQLRLSQIEGRTQTISDQLSELRDGLWQLRDEISEHFSQLTEREEQHKRRQIAEFEQYILQMKAQLGRNLKL